MRNIEKFWDRMAKGYSRSPVPDVAIYEEKLKITQQYFHRQSMVLEIGCGTGTTAIRHAPLVKKIDVIDISQNMLDIAQAKATEAGIQNIHFCRSSLEDYDPPKQKYDVCLAMSILHLLEKPKDALLKCHRALKPQGYLLTSTFALLDSHPFFRFVLPIGRLFGLNLLGFLPYVNFFTQADLRLFLKDAGFTIVKEWQPNSKKSKAWFIIAKRNNTH